jgi:hypothetical protein
MEAYVINLSHRTDRWEKMVKNWSPYFKLNRVEGLKITDEKLSHAQRATLGLSLTHKLLIEDAVKRGLKTILILEDDAVPEAWFYSRWVEMKTYMDTHLDQWEIFNGGIHKLQELYNVVDLKHGCLMDGKHGGASHFIYLNLSNGTDKLTNWESNWNTDQIYQYEKTEIDMYYNSQFKLFCAFPLLAKQANDVSDITNGDRSWDNLYMMNELSLRALLDERYLKYKSVKDLPEFGEPSMLEG